MRIGRAWLGILAVLIMATTPSRAQPPSQGTVLETRYLRLVIDASGRTTAFVDKATGTDYCSPEPFVVLQTTDGRTLTPSACTQKGGDLVFVFGPGGPHVTLHVLNRGKYLAITMDPPDTAKVSEVWACRVRTTLNRHTSTIAGIVSNDRFACALRTLDANIGFQLEGGGTPLLAATLETVRMKPGDTRAISIAALVGCPKSELRSVLKEVVCKENLLRSPLGGPYALDAEENRGSYVFAYGLSESNVDAWVRLCTSAGMAEVHLGDWMKSCGHYEPSHGLAGLKTAVAAIHKGGLKAGMHTLTGWISPEDAYVTPVPDKRLATDGTFTLTAGIGPADPEMLTAEKPHDLDKKWAIVSRGNVLRIDDELIQYGDYSEQAPYKFSKLVRGAFVTKAAAHAQGAKVEHLRVYALGFFPDEKSTLVDEIAANIANIYNTCQFDMIYMDGAEGTPGGWWGVYRMRAAIFSRLKRRALVEASEWGYESWPFHSRIGAWDYPNWGLKASVDLHCRNNEEIRSRSLLPAQLGWWCIFGPNEDRYAQLPDEVEYLFCKSLAFDMPMSFQGIGIGKPENERQDEYLAMIGRYEKLRLSRYFPDSVLAELRQPGHDFHLVQTPGGEWQFVPTDYMTHKASPANGTDSWTVRNRYAAQPARLRIRALYTAAPYGDGAGVPLTDFSGALPRVECSAGTTGRLDPSTAHAAPPGVPDQCAVFTAKASEQGGWARAAIAFNLPQDDLTKVGALGVWVNGDGQGEVLNFQLQNPTLYLSMCDEHYVKVDFTGWRYFELHLRERDAASCGDYKWPYGDQWPYGDSYYDVYRDAVYRHPLNRQAVNGLNIYGLNIYLGGLPADKNVKCVISPVRALPVAPAKLANPAVTIGSARIDFPVTLESGQYVEFDSMSVCRWYSETGKLLGAITPSGTAPELAADDNTVTFSSPQQDGHTVRAEVTAIAAGTPIRR